MRFSQWAIGFAGVALGAFGEQCNGQDCRASGRVSPVSLVQLKSKHEHLAAVLGTEEVMQLTTGHTAHEALLGYKKYLLELLNTTEYNLSITSQQQEAINIIKAMIDSFYTNMKSAYNDEVNIIKECNWEIDSCKTTRDDNELKREQGLVNDTRQKHHTCRDREIVLKAAKKEKCDDDYDKYRKEDPDALLPKCVGDGKLNDDYIKTDDPFKLGEMEACLENVHDWLDGLYPKYAACKAARDLYNQQALWCDANQTIFEDQSCTFAKEHDLECSEYLTCYKTELGFCADLCSNISDITEYRKADNKTGELVRCLLDVFNAKNDKKQDLMNACLTKGDTLDQSEWNHTCPAGFDVFPPPLAPLDPYLPNCAYNAGSPPPSIVPYYRPCDDAWKVDEYESEPWKEYLADCKKCV